MSTSTKLFAIVAAALWIAAAALILATPGGTGAATPLLAAGGILAAVALMTARRDWLMQEKQLAKMRAETFALAMRVTMPIGAATARAAEDVAETPPRGIVRG